MSLGFFGLIKKTEIKKEETKEEPQLESQEILEIKTTKDFILALQQGNIKLARARLQEVKENRKNFPQYKNSWLVSQQKEIDVYQQLKNDGVLEKMIFESKEALQDELWEKFGFNSRHAFEKILENRKFQEAEEGLKYIKNNKLRFYFLLTDWNYWFNCHEKIKKAKKDPNY